MGYRRVLADYRLPVDEALITAGNYDLESGSRLFCALLDMPQPPTAVFVTNYDMTLGAIMAAHERGVTLPDEMDFIGYDNVDLCSIVSPKLEIVEQPHERDGPARGRTAVGKTGRRRVARKAAAPQGEAVQSVSPARKGV